MAHAKKKRDNTCQYQHFELSMAASFLACLLAFVATLLVIRLSNMGFIAGLDSDLSGPQKFHALAVPRLGGIGLVMGILLATPLLDLRESAEQRLVLTLLLCAVPAFGAGLLEDFTRKVSPAKRLVATALSAALAGIFLPAQITHTGLSAIDAFYIGSWFALPLTVFAVAGLANAVNIIDGFNGLASMTGAIMLAAIAHTAFLVDDRVVLGLALLGIGAIIGFFLWNFPLGLIFLGDGGAYFMGFYLAELAILLVQRNDEVSPFFPVLVFIYPISETLFSIYRRRFVRAQSPSAPDGVHLHQLIYRRLIRFAVGQEHAKVVLMRNSLTSPYLWTLSAVSVVPATLWWHETYMLMGFCLLFVATYVWLYARIVRFRTPRWLVLRITLPA
jgi:UDP-N-acetylmuramyl pentapeptide phosphotransferase/UDP-N-acetylglucosamine-1-phosphate transferase